MIDLARQGLVEALEVALLLRQPGVGLLEVALHAVAEPDEAALLAGAAAIGAGKLLHAAGHLGQAHLHRVRPRDHRLLVVEEAERVLGRHGGRRREGAPRARHAATSFTISKRA